MSQGLGGLLGLPQELSPNALPVWRRLVAQLVISLLLGGSVVVVFELLGVGQTNGFLRYLAPAFTALPVALWLLISVRPEYRTLRPRRRLISVAIVAGLLASAIGVPLVQDFFRVDQWLPHESAFRRVLGFALTAGMTDAGLKLLVLRYMIIPTELRLRADCVAYALASAIGYSFFLNLELIGRVQPAPSIAAILVLANLVSQVASAMFIAIGISESVFSDALPPVLPINLLAAAFSTGIIITFASGLMGGTLTTSGSSDRPFFGIAFVIVATGIALGVSAFLYRVSERREREFAFGPGAGDEF